MSLRAALVAAQCEKRLLNLAAIWCDAASDWDATVPPYGGELAKCLLHFECIMEKTSLRAPSSICSL